MYLKKVMPDQIIFHSSDKKSCLHFFHVNYLMTMQMIDVKDAHQKIKSFETLVKSMVSDH